MPGAWMPDGHVTDGSAPFASTCAERKPASSITWYAGSVGSALKSPTTTSGPATGSSHAASAVAWSARTDSSGTRWWRWVTVEVERRPARKRDGHAKRRAVAIEVDPLAFAQLERLLAQDGVAVFRPSRPAAARGVAALARRAEQPVLLDREHALLEPDEIRLERGHVGEEQGNSLRPAVRDIAQVQGRDDEAVSHRPVSMPRSPRLQRRVHRRSRLLVRSRPGPAGARPARWRPGSRT